MTSDVVLDLHPLTLEDVPDPSSPAFQQFLDDRFEMGKKLIGTMEHWNKHSSQHKGTVQVMSLPSSSSYNSIRKDLHIKEFWCGRMSEHTTESVRESTTEPHGRPSISDVGRSISARLGRRSSEGKLKHVNGNGHGGDDAPPPSALTDVERQEQIFNQRPSCLYERFRRGLLEYHSENEREYIESCRETECLEVFQPHVAEVWRLTYVTPPPTNPRTFVVLLLSRELVSEPVGQRSFMNISIPFNHPSCKEKTGSEKSHVRGKYVSVELVTEKEDGAKVEWKMATSSDAGGNIPRFVTNSSLPGKITEDVPSFLRWMVGRFPEGGEVASEPVAAA